MTAASSSDPARVALRGVVSDAAAGVLPSWAVASPGRRAHVARVAALAGAWADALRLTSTDAGRWRAAAVLHDALRDEDPARLAEQLGPPFRDWPPGLRHGPAVAARLADEGVDDTELLDAIRYHTIGHESFGPLGRALYAADWLEPGRPMDPLRRAVLRARMPGALDAVVRSIAQARLAHVIARGRPLRPETLAFWNRLAGEAHG